ncbi:MAG: methionine synthase, partial [Bacteroidetes bacterium]
ENIKNNNLLKANAAIGIFEANAENETIFANNNGEVIPFEFLRNQEDNKDTNYCLSDFIAPNTSNIKDYMGLFAVSTGFNIEKTVQQYESEGDDYNAIMIKILADRLAEAFAELMHYKLRTEFWGYSPTEKINQDDLLKEKYRGIRPAPGYSACPEHSEKRKIFDLMNIENKTGIVLTDGYSMYPAASVCGYYFSHPEAKYFDVAKISKDQVEDYANRKNMKVKDIEVLLNSNINY